MELGRPSHWTKIVSSEAGEIFTLGMNYSKPWAYDFKDTKEGNTSNCLLYCPDWISSWKEWKCFALQRGCPCTSDSPPVLQLPGSVCKSSYIKPQRYTLRQSLRDPKTVIMVGLCLGYQLDLEGCPNGSDCLVSWEAPLDCPRPGCSGDQITLEMKLTGCQQKGEFTCNVGQCIRMKERCNQLPNCRDKSDE